MTSTPVPAPRADGVPVPGSVSTSEPAPRPPAAPDPRHGPRRRAYRPRDRAWIAGVCSGIAEHVSWPVVWIRIAFVALAFSSGLGVLVYAMLWLFLPRAQPGPQTVGQAANTRGGLRSEVAKPRRPARRIDPGVLIALITLGLGVIWLLQLSGVSVAGPLFWPVAFACVGVALLWQQADSGSTPPATDPAKRRWFSPLLRRQGWLAMARVVVGFTLVGSAIAVVIASQTGLAMLPHVLAMIALAFGGVALVAAPWIYRGRVALRTAREEKLLADARADMAAHLHDSVLQTLALIQRQSDDPRAVSTLARRQERELRTWLYGEPAPEARLKAGIARAAAEVEDERGVPVEVVVVGDCDLTDDSQALVQATREAIMNAAKHSGAPMIDVYAEVDDDQIAVFVRDRGSGFDPDTIEPDRQGVRSSIIERMKRHGGKATIRSAPGDGTEVRLEMRR